MGIIKTDVLHSWNLGIGGDLAAGAIVSLARLKVFGGMRALQARLDAAYESFSAWCVINQKSPTTKSFEKKTFKLNVSLVEVC